MAVQTRQQRKVEEAQQVEDQRRSESSGANLTPMEELIGVDYDEFVTSSSKPRPMRSEKRIAARQAARGWAGSVPPGANGEASSQPPQEGEIERADGEEVSFSEEGAGEPPLLGEVRQRSSNKSS